MMHEEFFHLDPATVEAAIAQLADSQMGSTGLLHEHLLDGNPALKLRQAMLSAFDQAFNEFGPKVAFDSIICLVFRLGAAYARLAASHVDA